MIFAETPRLYLRALEISDLPRLTELIGNWDVAKWMLVVPHPYLLKDAEEFFHIQRGNYEAGKPGFFAIADKSDGAFMGGIGLHPRHDDPRPETIVMGYWLGKSFWGRGFMSEAAKSVVGLAFQRPEIALVTATTDPANQSSQNVLRKAGLKYLGVFPRTQPGLRGGPEETCWELDRKTYERHERLS